MPLLLSSRVNNIGASIDGDNIAVLKDIVTGYAMYHLMIHRGADTCRVVIITIKVRDSALFFQTALENFIELCGTHPGLCCRNCRIQRTASYDACARHVM